MRAIWGFFVGMSLCGPVLAQGLFPDLAAVRQEGASQPELQQIRSTAPQREEAGGARRSMTLPGAAPGAAAPTTTSATVSAPIPTSGRARAPEARNGRPRAGGAQTPPRAAAPGSVNESLIAVFGEDMSGGDPDFDAGDFGETAQQQDAWAEGVPVALSEAGEAVEEEQVGPNSGRVRLVLDNVKNTLAPARNFSFCSGTLILENQLPMEIGSVSVRLGFGDQTVNLSFSGVAKKGKQSRSISLNGTACEHILEMPQMEVTGCQIGTLSEKDCKSRVQYIPF